MKQQRIEKWAIVITPTGYETVFDCFVFTDKISQIIEFNSKEEMDEYIISNTLFHKTEQLLGEQQ